jgi:hypothetical protein
MKNPSYLSYVEEVVQEMCNRVGANYNSIDFEEPNWYLQYSWTKEEEQSFQDWLVNYLRKKGYPKKWAEKDASIFLLHCGWTRDL